MTKLLCQVSTSGREFEAELVEKSELGEAYIVLEDGSKRWIPPHWIILEEES